jgi:hypothetical protein
MFVRNCHSKLWYIPEERRSWREKYQQPCPTLNQSVHTANSHALPLTKLHALPTAMPYP